MCAALLEPKPGDSTDPNGTSPLHLAAKNGHIDIIRSVTDRQTDIQTCTLLIQYENCLVISFSLFFLSLSLSLNVPLSVGY